MSFGIKGRFDGFEEEVEEAITEAVEGEQRSESKLSGLQQKAIKQKVVSIVERRLNGDPEADAGASKAAIAKSSGEGGGGSGLVSSEDRAAAIERACGPDGGSDGVAAQKSADPEWDTNTGVRRRLKLLKGDREPRTAGERRIADATGEERERIVSMLENEVGGTAAAVKRANDDAGDRHSGGSAFKQPTGDVAPAGSPYAAKQRDEE